MKRTTPVQRRAAERLLRLEAAASGRAAGVPATARVTLRLRRVLATLLGATGFRELSHYTISFLTDDIIRLRYVEIDGQLRKVLVVVKMRGGNHSKDIREYMITDEGVVIIAPHQTGYTRLITGLPVRTGQWSSDPAPEPRALPSRKRGRARVS